METDPTAPATAGFDSFGLDASILQAIKEQGYTQATPIQAKAIPVVLQGRDVMGAAQTGTGKTAAFTLPIIQLLLSQANTSASPARHPVRALILTPTRELADQVADNVAKYGCHTPLRSAVVFGGVDISPQTAQLRSGVEILIATPGRLLDHVQQKTANLSQVQMLVLDEADRMLDMGFLPDLQRIINLLPQQRQTLLFSATFSAEIRKLSGSYLRNPQAIEVARQNATSDNVRQVIYGVSEGLKRAAVVHILAQRAAAGQSAQCIVFSNSKINCSRLARALVTDGIKASAIHGDKTQIERMQTLEAFKKGEIDALVATDVAARGLDISDMPCVINFDLPYNAEDYVHRIGRTGRAGASGDAISLFSPGDEKLLADIEELTKRKLPVETLQGVAAEAHVRHDRERSREGRDEGRRPRREDREDRRERSTSTSYAAPRRQPDDPLFSQPYEPRPRTETPAAADASSKAQEKARKPVAALLGGLRK
ncbi:MAG: DEAD/DEAH box helicase [Candidatus Protistobacter heckmanni]|nr:DEAD/DEAH box helicase [Candidatus Protistobacter heckmanni]